MDILGSKMNIENLAEKGLALIMHHLLQRS